jgi:hypothetical protein
VREIRILNGKAEGKTLLGRPKRKWEDNIKVCIKEIEHEDVGWINLAQHRDQLRAVVNTVLKFSVR